MSAEIGRTGFVLAAALLLGSAAAASDLPALLRAAGTSRHVAEWPEANATAREHARAALTAERHALLLREVAQAFPPEHILAALATSLGKRLPEDSVAPLARSFTTNRVAPLLGADSELAAADLRDFPRFASDVSRQEVPAARFELVARLDDGSGVGRDSWSTTLAWGAAIERGTRALSCDGTSVWTSPLSPETVALRERLAEPFRERVHLELLFLARAVDPRELRRAVTFLETEPAQSFRQQQSAALREALDAALRDLRARLAPAIAESCP